MKAAKWYAKKDIRVENVPEPSAPKPGEVKVKVAWCGICGMNCFTKAILLSFDIEVFFYENVMDQGLDSRRNGGDRLPDPIFDRCLTFRQGRSVRLFDLYREETG